jgi:hypothetical protein
MCVLSDDESAQRDVETKSNESWADDAMHSRRQAVNAAASGFG